MEFFTYKSSYNYLSDYPVDWDATKGTQLKLDLSVNGTTSSITIPSAVKYKYLGVWITHNLSPQVYIKELKRKINFLANAFRSVGGASQSLKYCTNIWHVFVRPLLDYSQTYFSFLEDRHRKVLYTLYRQSARKVTFLKEYTPNDLVDRLIQYDYKNLHTE